MLTYIWLVQIAVIIFIISVLLILCFITDLPRVLGLSFSRRETISKYIKKYMKKDMNMKKIVCNFKMIASKTNKNIQDVYIYMYVAKYIIRKKKLITDFELYSKAKVTLTRKFGIYNVVNFITEIENPLLNGEDFFPEFIVNSNDYHEYINPKVNRFLKEANIKKAKKRFILKRKKRIE